ncbi:metallophosphoesterase [Candidatus Woesearchaeota archaeon]|nr:metallophosphoesterase [Candidatus Woesearchaeota archaeon]
METKEEIIKKLFEKGILLNKELLDNSSEATLTEMLDNAASENDILVLNDDYLSFSSEQKTLVDWHEIDRYRVEVEKERNEKLYQTELQSLREIKLKTPAISTSSTAPLTPTPPTEEYFNITSDATDANYNYSDSTLLSGIEKSKMIHTPPETRFPEVHTFSSLETELQDGAASVSLNIKNEDSYSIISDSKDEAEAAELSAHLLIHSEHKLDVVYTFSIEPQKFSPAHFTSIFISRYNFLEKILRQRSELQGTIAIGRLLKKKEKEKVSIIGLVENISLTKNGNLIVTLEDLTGKISVIISKNRADIFAMAKDLVFDEVVGLSGTFQDKIIFAEEFFWPDVPETNEMKKGDLEEYAIFLSDVHVGSSLFLKEEFNKFLQWINCLVGNEQQREIASKVKYVIISGDLVDGVGIYPGQEKELEIKDIVGQYAEFANLIKKIPSDKQIVLCAGNHDVTHIAEPQTLFYKEFAPALYELPNVTMVSNPAMINIGKSKTFSGLDVLMYHGFSFDYYVANVESIRNGGGYHRADLIMKFLLKRRHLAPSFKSTPYVPGYKDDPLLIRKIPDIMVSGHIHYCSVANYKGVTLICGSCWQAKTTFQEKLGHDPEPARVPLVNLKTRQVKILNFN